ncbi:methylenetetrahydrofolate reductase [Brevibacterium sp. BRM-1]|uniref:methylenetetrahydrofolate reductase n=1 Tax=Brevibacterium sp. BRM-1 TaxID=2999062 RepID=UPI0022818AD5|nr:methylenetetrahydrofolate reductase [Brevibacterium sp. BRM-1]WAL39909.1 methylenetetrahydrofolate reductase [Brevibacterium sp. BRM-1]
MDISAAGAPAPHPARTAPAPGPAADRAGTPAGGSGTPADGSGTGADRSGTAVDRPAAARSASAPLDAAGVGDPLPERATRPALSFEVIPPRTAAAHRALPALIETIGGYRPDYVAITSSPTSGWSQGTADFVSALAADPRLRPLAHLTCTGAPRPLLEAWIDHFVAAGVRGFLAIRGDLPPGARAPQPGHLRHADELVSLIRTAEAQQAARFCAGRLAVGVAAYPGGHPESPDRDFDIDVLLAKQRTGADFALTQLFFDPRDYADLVRRARLAGVTLPIIPGIFPLTSPRRLERMGRLAGLRPPPQLARALAAAPTPAAQRDIGLAATAALARAVLAAGAPGLHLYTFNDAEVTGELLDRLDLAPAAPAAALRPI